MCGSRPNVRSGRLEHLGFLVRLYCGGRNAAPSSTLPDGGTPPTTRRPASRWPITSARRRVPRPRNPPLRGVSGPCATHGAYPPHRLRCASCVDGTRRTRRGAQLCQPCHVTTERYIRSHLDDLGHVVMVTCAREQCRSEFITARWRDPAYCSDRCRTSQFKDRQKDKQAATEREGTIW